MQKILQSQTLTELFNHAQNLMSQSTFRRTARTVGTSPGFTIVELLIVVVIISILAAIATVTYSGIQQRARDTQRKSDITVIEKAIELYYVDNGRYPMNNGWCTQISNPTNGWGTAFQSAIAPYLTKTPLDPMYAGTYQDYLYQNVNGQSFHIYAELEESDQSDDSLTGCTRIDGLNNEYDYRDP